ncbi:MAG: PadR family transcriptional regulator [Asgard group archaeon]|nr:PadR family transcriptional regulator [Asgard group archaeon]
MWILDSVSGAKKISPIQVAILIEFAKSGIEPIKITDIIIALDETFGEFWDPSKKKGTIYPAVHNLHVRGFLKMHGLKPYGYSITDKGMEVIDKMTSQLNKQMEVYMVYYSYFIQNYSKINAKRANEIKENIIKSMKNYIEEFD